jgi:hypothetical protein
VTSRVPRESSEGQTRTLDGVTFDVIVHRLRVQTRYGGWLVRVYAGDEHVHSAEGGVTLEAGLREAERAMRCWVEGLR